MRAEKAISAACRAIDNCLVSWAIVHWMIERVVIAVEKKIDQFSHWLISLRAHFIEFEKMPICSLIDWNHAESNSVKSATSMSGFSAITHVHTSIPAAIADGVDTPEGKATM